MNPIKTFHDECWRVVHGVNAVFAKHNIRKPDFDHEQFNADLNAIISSVHMLNLRSAAIASTDDPDVRRRIEELFQAMTYFITFAPDGIIDDKIVFATRDALFGVHPFAGDNPPASGVQSGITQGGATEEPVKVLFGWAEILDAIELTNDKQDMVNRLNKESDGPIISNQGGKVRVVRAKLIEWWNKMFIEYEEKKHQADGARLEAESQHNYGKTGSVSEIGSVKKRRSDRKTSG